MHNKGATRHGVVPTIVGQEVGLDKAQPLNRSTPRNGCSGGVSLSAGANCPNHLIALLRSSAAQCCPMYPVMPVSKTRAGKTKPFLFS